MVRAAELFRAALRFGDYGGGVMAAYVIEGPQLAIFSAGRDERLAGQLRCKKLATVAHLIRAAHDLPRITENAHALECRETLIEIPRSGNRPGLFQRIVRVI